MSTSKVNFLDVSVLLNDNVLTTTLYSKATDAHLYLNASSNHPKHVIRNIPKGQFIRVRRICSTLNEYTKHCKILSDFFIKRGYDAKSMNDTINEIAKIDRKTLLEDKSREEKDPQTIFVSDWHPSLGLLPSILKRHFHLIENEKTLSKIFPAKPSVAFRRPKSLRNHLIRNDILPQPKTTPSSSGKCGNSCKLCKNMSSALSITNLKKGITVEIKDFGTCQSRELVYGAICKKHKLIYVGQTGEKICDRFSKHRYDVKKRPTNTEFAEHFHKNHTENDLEVVILQTGLKTEEERIHNEDKWICQLQTLHPSGINADVKQYAKDMYNCYKRTS